MAIITRTHAQRLVRSGKARIECLLYEPDRFTGQPTHVIVMRYDAQRYDHYRVTPADLRSIPQ